MGIVESTSGSSPEKKLSIPVSGQILISVHGSSQSGKTTLVNHMIKVAYSDVYRPTAKMESTQVIWQSVQCPDHHVRVVVWDVVEKAKDPSSPDARTVDTISRADGVVVIYDPDDGYSASYALNVLYKIPQSTPVIVLSNFLDLRGNRHKVHPILRSVPFTQIQTSLKTGIGLDIIALWIDKAVLYNRKKSLSAQLKCVIDESQELFSTLKYKAQSTEERLRRPDPRKILIIPQPHQMNESNVKSPTPTKKCDDDQKVYPLRPNLMELLKESPKTETIKPQKESVEQNKNNNSSQITEELNQSSEEIENNNNSQIAEEIENNNSSQITEELNPSSEEIENPNYEGIPSKVKGNFEITRSQPPVIL